MKHWHERPVEIRNLFNPAFCGLVLCRAFAGFEEIDSDGMPFSLSLLVLPLCLHKESREIIHKNQLSYMLKIIESNPQILLGFSSRASNLLPFTFEGLGYSMFLDCFEITEGARFKTVAKAVRKKITGTDESQQIQKTARIVGRGFAKISDRVTIYKSLGVKP